MDTGRLQQSWSRVAQHGDAVPAFFYAALFAHHPHLRQLFPVSMASQRDRLVAALGRIVAGVDRLADVTPYLADLGRDHRRFDVRPEHYPAVGDALLATLAQFLGPDWDPDLAADWAKAYRLVAQTMCDAATAADGTPAYWTAGVVEVDRRGLDIAVVRLHVNGPRLPYVAGQSCAMEVPSRPRVWRYYSIANAPDDSRLLELHVKAVPGGQVSTAIQRSLHPGDEVRLGPPVGEALTLDPDSVRDLLLLAGGTGLAPMKCIVEQVAAHGGGRRVMLVVGARTTADLYDLPALEAMADRLPWLTVIPALSHDRHARAVERGTPVDIALRLGVWTDHDIYLCGPPDMVTTSRDRMAEAGILVERLHYEDGTTDPYRPEPPIKCPAADLDEVPFL